MLIHSYIFHQAYNPSLGKVMNSCSIQPPGLPLKIKMVWEFYQKLGPSQQVLHILCPLLTCRCWSCRYHHYLISIFHGEKMGLEIDPYLGSNHGNFVSQWAIVWHQPHNWMPTNNFQRGVLQLFCCLLIGKTVLLHPAWNDHYFCVSGKVSNLTEWLACFDGNPPIIHYHALLMVLKKMQKLTCDWAKQGQKSAIMGGLLCPLFSSNCFLTITLAFFHLMKFMQLMLNFWQASRPEHPRMTFEFWVKV